MRFGLSPLQFRVQCRSGDLTRQHSQCSPRPSSPVANQIPAAEQGIDIHSTGGETADVGDLVRTIIVDSTVTCRMKRSEVITNEKIGDGELPEAFLEECLSRAWPNIE